MTRVPLLYDSRLLVADASPEDVVLRPPPEREALGDVARGVRDALAFPLAGEPLERLARRGGTATVVIEPPALPIPSTPVGPRHVAVAAAVDELDRLGVSQVTILVAGGLARRATPRAIGQLVPPEFRRRFRGRVIVHDVEGDDLVTLGAAGGVPLRVSPALTETDLVVTVTAAETVLTGGPAALLAAAGWEALAAAGAPSLLETGGSAGWQVAVALEQLLAARVPVTGVSLLLNAPRTDAIERLLSSPVRRLYQVAPSRLRRRLLEEAPRELTAAAAYGGTPSVAHMEALLRGIVFKGIELAEPLDALVVGIPPTTPWLPREPPNPVTAAYLGLGLALRLWRNEPPVRENGTLVLVHPFVRRFPRPTQEPYRALFNDPEALHAPPPHPERAAEAIAEYRAGRGCHPLLPLVEWRACAAVASRLGAVLVAGCRDAHAARRLGFVPQHSLGAALDVARGRGAERIGYLLSPPFHPLVVGGGL
ncbi:MAG TPA: lactate racemase domain-containing protein [Gaiellaceae bacterium]|nr:lactate racemase domain-containing protein [Gaiellaceae bacterium]